MNKLWTIIGISLYVAVLLWSIVSMSWSVSLLLALSPLLLRNVMSSAFCVLIPFSLFNSGLFVPNLPGQFQVYQLWMMIYVGLCVMKVAIHKRMLIDLLRFDSLCALFMIGWIVLLMWIRGAGMRILGSSQHGGAVYIQTVFALCFYFFTMQESLPLRKVRLAGIWMGLLALLPLLANGVFELSGGQIRHQMYFFRTGAASAVGASSFLAGQESRLSFMSFGSALLWVGLFASGANGHRQFAKWCWWAVAGVCSVLSGFRSTVLGVFSFFVAYGVFTCRRKWFFSVLGLLCGVAIYALAVVYARSMPFAVQRVLSMVPGVEVSWKAEVHGRATMLWRRELWSRARNDVSRYWLLGRGVTFTAGETVMPVGVVDGFRVAYVTGAFHQATLELLILYGLPFLMACLGFYIYTLHTIRKACYGPMGGIGLEKQYYLIGLWLYCGLRTGLAFAGGSSDELLVELPVYLAMFHLVRNAQMDHEDVG